MPDTENNRADLEQPQRIEALIADAFERQARILEGLPQIEILAVSGKLFVDYLVPSLRGALSSRYLDATNLAPVETGIRSALKVWELNKLRSPELLTETDLERMRDAAASLREQATVLRARAHDSEQPRADALAQEQQLRAELQAFSRYGDILETRLDASSTADQLLKDYTAVSISYGRDSESVQTGELAYSEAESQHAQVDEAERLVITYDQASRTGALVDNEASELARNAELIVKKWQQSLGDDAPTTAQLEDLARQLEPIHAQTVDLGSQLEALKEQLPPPALEPPDAPFDDGDLGAMDRSDLEADIRDAAQRVVEGDNQGLDQEQQVASLGPDQGGTATDGLSGDDANLPEPDATGAFYTYVDADGFINVGTDDGDIYDATEGPAPYDDAAASSPGLGAAGPTPPPAAPSLPDPGSGRTDVLESAVGDLLNRIEEHQRAFRNLEEGQTGIPILDALTNLGRGAEQALPEPQPLPDASAKTPTPAGSSWSKVGPSVGDALDATAVPIAIANAFHAVRQNADESLQAAGLPPLGEDEEALLAAIAQKWSLADNQSLASSIQNDLNHGLAVGKDMEQALWDAFDNNGGIGPFGGHSRDDNDAEYNFLSPDGDPEPFPTDFTPNGDNDAEYRFLSPYGDPEPFPTDYAPPDNDADYRYLDPNAYEDAPFSGQDPSNPWALFDDGDLYDATEDPTGEWVGSVTLGGASADSVVEIINGSVSSAYGFYAALEGGDALAIARSGVGFANEFSANFGGLDESTASTLGGVGAGLGAVTAFRVLGRFLKLSPPRIGTARIGLLTVSAQKGGVMPSVCLSA